MPELTSVTTKEIYSFAKENSHNPKRDGFMMRRMAVEIAIQNDPNSVQSLTDEIPLQPVAAEINNIDPADHPVNEHDAILLLAEFVANKTLNTDK